MFTDIAEGSGSKQCVTNGMDQHIGIAVSEKSFLVRHLHAPEHQRSSSHKAVHVNTKSYTEHDCVAKKLSTSEQVAQAVEVKGQGDTQSAVERVGAVGSNDIACVNAEHVHAEARTYGEVFATAL